MRNRAKDYELPEKEMLPVHVGIIMDGNGRWAKKRLMPRAAGHRAGMSSVKRIVKYASDIGIKALTLYAFSTENWNRPRDEVSALMGLLIEYLTKELDEMHRNGVIVRVIGDMSILRDDVKAILTKSIEKTKNNSGMVLNLAINYGSRDEMTDMVKSIARDAASGIIDPEDINEEMISGRLYTAGVPDPDLIIRTSGELRLSNFLMYQAAYSELYFTDVLWPDFKEYDFSLAMLEYAKRSRRYGKI